MKRQYPILTQYFLIFDALDLWTLNETVDTYIQNLDDLEFEKLQTCVVDSINTGNKA